MIKVSTDISRLSLTIKPHLPPSKSIAARALLLTRLCTDGAAPIANLPDCDDTRAMLRGLDAPSPLIDVQGAGTAMRFLTAYYACREGSDVVLTGVQRMRQRPIGPLVDALRTLGADISYTEHDGFPPLHIVGRQLHGANVAMDGSVSSQFVSALLMIAPLCGPMRLTLTGHIVSRPYIEMTLALMKHFGAPAAWEDEHTLYVPRGEYHSRPLTVEPDWTAASYWLAIEKIAFPLLSAKEKMMGASLPDDTIQGDSICRWLFDTMPSAFDFTDHPDLVQTMAVAYCLMDKPFTFTGVQNLRLKETDRVLALTTELAKLGYKVEVVEDSAGGVSLIHPKDDSSPFIHDPSAVPVIDTYGDHRMAMAFAPAALRFHEIIITHPEVVSKSYPLFWDDLRRAGFNIETI